MEHISDRLDEPIEFGTPDHLALGARSIGGHQLIVFLLAGEDNDALTAMGRDNTVGGLNLIQTRQDQIHQHFIRLQAVNHGDAASPSAASPKTRISQYPGGNEKMRCMNEAGMSKYLVVDTYLGRKANDGWNYQRQAPSGLTLAKPVLIRGFHDTYHQLNAD